MFKRFQAEWKALSTAEKCNFVLDIICRVGAAFAGNRVGRMLTKDAGKVETICVQTFTTGLGIAAGKVAGEAIAIPEEVLKAREEKTNG